MPVFDGEEFFRVHVNNTFTNDHSKVLYGGGIKGALKDFEGQAMFPETRKDLMSSLVMQF